ncbi:MULTISPECIES: PIN domain-containing protein [Pseudomonas syringae group]|nr:MULTISPECIES: PIN domain-containing protein [Pseudomonas syringae group]
MATMQLFIDTNIFLNLYTYPDDDDGVVDELLDHIGADKIVLHLPKQVENEFERNRESKLHDAVREFQSRQFPTAVPNHMRGTDAAKRYQAAIDGAKEARRQLIANATSLALQNVLPMDEKIIGLFAKAARYEEDDVVFRLAVERSQRGNPPGKGDGVGDRYNWETLLMHVPAGDLYVISKDGDYASPFSSFDKTTVRPKKYLSEEWSKLKEGGSLHIYTTIKAVMSRFRQLVQQEQLEVVAIEQAPPVIPMAPVSQVPIPTATATTASMPPTLTAAPQPPTKDPALAAQIREAIGYLENSGSFATTHAAIANLEPYLDVLDYTDATLLFNAAVDNSQVRWVLSDDDVNNFYLKLTSRFLAAVDPALASQVVDLMDLAPSSGEEDNEAELRDYWEGGVE